MSSSEKTEAEAAFAALSARIEALFPDVQSLSANELDSLRGNEEVVLVDVREPEERSLSTVEGSLTIKKAEERLLAMPPVVRREAAVVCFCTVGLRSGAYATGLSSRFGLRGARNYSLLRHVWDGRSLSARIGPGKWQESTNLHMFSSKYSQMAPAHVSTVVFSAPVALTRAIAYVPSFIRAFLVRKRGGA